MESFDRFFRLAYFSKVDKITFFFVRAIIIANNNTLVLTQLFVDTDELFDCLYTARSVYQSSGAPSPCMAHFLSEKLKSYTFACLKTWINTRYPTYLNNPDGDSSFIETRKIQKRKADTYKHMSIQKMQRFTVQ
jgi:hypothetical protein